MYSVVCKLQVFHTDQCSDVLQRKTTVNLCCYVHLQVQRHLLDELFSENKKANSLDDFSKVQSSEAAGCSLLENNSFRKLHDLCTESRICLLGAVLAMVDVEYLAVCHEHEAVVGTFLTHVIAKHLLSLSDRLVWLTFWYDTVNHLTSSIFHLL
jgi:hypothetical protein